MQLKQSNKCSGVGQFLACAVVAAALIELNAPTAQAQAAAGAPIELPGTVVAFIQVNLHTKISGFVKKVTHDIGDHVKAGEVLAILREPEIEQQLKQKEALVLKAQTNVIRAKSAANVAAATLARAKAAVKEAEAGQLESQAQLKRWNAEYERAKELVKKNVFDQATLEETVHQLKAAEAAVQQAAEKIKCAEAGVVEAAAKREAADADIQCAEADLTVAKADVDYVKEMLDYRMVVAPFDCVVSMRNVNEGDLVVPPKDRKADPLFTVIRTDRVRVVVQIPEKESLRVLDGTPATIRFQALPDQEIKATVTRTTWALDAKTRTLKAEIHLVNAGEKLRPGMYCTVVLNPKK